MRNAFADDRLELLGEIPGKRITHLDGRIELRGSLCQHVREVHPGVLSRILHALEEIQRELSIAFPIHPRRRKRLSEFGLTDRADAMPGLLICDALGYLDFLGLIVQSNIVITDSGGLHEKTTTLGISCLTLRENTERPVTVTEGTNIVVSVNPELIVADARRAISGEGKTGRIPPLWDGKASDRIAEVFRRWENNTHHGIAT